MKKQSALAWILLSLALAGCHSGEAGAGRAVSPALIEEETSGQEEVQWVRRSQPLMGTFAVVAAHGPDQTRLQDGVSAAFAAMHRIDRAMSLHRFDSELVQVNLRAASDHVTVSSDLYEVLRMAQAVAVESGGAFDVTVGPLADLWGFIWKEYRMPTEAELARALPAVNYRLVQLDAARRTAHFLKPGVSLDLGGIAKGYAVDCATEAMRAAGVSNALVRIGGDLRVLGHAPGLAGWDVKLEDPLKRGRRRTLLLVDAALSTAGDYENFFEVSGRRYGHLIDPRTGQPVSGVTACTVVAGTCMESDAWSSALFVMGPDRGLALVGQRLAVEYTLIAVDGEPHLTTRASALFGALQRDQSPRTQ